MNDQPFDQLTNEEKRTANVAVVKQALVGLGLKFSADQVPHLIEVPMNFEGVELKLSLGSGARAIWSEAVVHRLAANARVSDALPILNEMNKGELYGAFVLDGLKIVYRDCLIFDESPTIDSLKQLIYGPIIAVIAQKEKLKLL